MPHLSSAWNMELYSKMGLVHDKINSDFTELCSSSQLDKIVSANSVFTDV